MDDEMFDTQCRDVAKCIEGLSLSLLEAEGSSSISKIVADVHRLIQSFRLLGNHYVSELLKKCRELERKSQEVKELSCRLAQGERHTDHAGTLKKPDVQFGIDAQRPGETSNSGDCQQSVEELSKREHDLSKPGPYVEIFPSLCSTQELDRSAKEFTLLQGDRDENREERLKVPDKAGERAVSNEFLSSVRDENAKRSIETQTGPLHATEAVYHNIFPVQGSGQANKHENLLNYPSCSNTKDFAQATQVNIEILPGERAKGVNSSTVGRDEENFWQILDELGTIELSCNKRPREFINRITDSQERKKSNSTPWSKTGQLNDRQNLDLQSSHKINQGTVHGKVAQEQIMVESVCKALEHYQHEFLEK